MPYTEAQFQGLEKRCSRCETIKRVEEFSSLPSKPDGKHNYCKKCRCAYASEWIRKGDNLKKSSERSGKFHAREREMVHDNYVRYLLAKIDRTIKVEPPKILVETKKLTIRITRKLKEQENGCTEKRKRTQHKTVRTI